MMYGQQNTKSEKKIWSSLLLRHCSAFLPYSTAHPRRQSFSSRSRNNHRCDYNGVAVYVDRAHQ